jgi:hypothetical protein
MALMNLHKVTKTLTGLLMQNITTSIDSGLAGVLKVTDLPPEKVENPTHTLNFYLYHVAEDPYYKNMQGSGTDIPSVATAPMALCLYYILTAHHENDNDPSFNAQAQQMLMGYALKTFHDVPVITDETRINGSSTPVLQDALLGKGNSLQVIMRPIPAEDAVAFWSSEDTRTARLSAYYEVRVIMLEPEPPKRMPGIVLSLGAFVHEMGVPYIDCTRSTLHFPLPAAAGGGVQAIDSTPARVSTDTGAAPANNRLELIGTNLTGRSQSIMLKNTLWSKRPDALGGSVEAIELDLALNAADWSATFRSDRITLELASQLNFVNPAGAPDQVDVVPGLYSAQIRVVHGEKETFSQVKQFSSRSNEVAFYVIPRITAVTAAANELIIAVAPTFDLNQGEAVADNRPVLDVQVVVEGVVYERIATATATAEGQFSPDANSVNLRPPFPVLQPGLRPVRLVVNGAESQPFWYEVVGP